MIQARLSLCHFRCVCMSVPFSGWAHCCSCLGLHCSEHCLVATMKEVELREVQTGKADAIHVAIELSQVVTPAWADCSMNVCVGVSSILLTHIAGPRFEENSQ